MEAILNSASARVSTLVLSCLLVGISGCDGSERPGDPVAGQGGSLVGLVEPAPPPEQLHELGGPTHEVRALWSAATGNNQALATAVNGLADWFEQDGKHLLERKLDYSFIESLALEDLRAVDVVGLATAGWDPTQAFGIDEEGLDAHLATARGLLAMSLVQCSIDKVAAMKDTPGTLQLTQRKAQGTFAGQVYDQSLVRASRSALLDIDGATTRVILELEVQVGSESIDVLGAEIKQRWQLDLWLERSDETMLRMRTAWIEASSARFGPDSRVWMGWVLHDAFADSENWNRLCGEAPENTEPATGTASLEAGIATPSRREPPARPVPPSATAPGIASPTPTMAPPMIRGDVAPICATPRLIEFEAWGRRMAEMNHSSLGSIDGDQVQGPEDRFWIDWMQAGLEAWSDVLGLDLTAVVPADLARLRRVVERFGNHPRMFSDKSRLRLRSRWRKGLLHEMLGAEPVLVPVCPSSTEYTANKLGYTTPEQRRRKQDDIDQITAVALFEHGSVRDVTEAEWQAIREAFAFGEAIMDLFRGPAHGPK